MKQIWKDIEGYEGLYQINNNAEIKSLSRIIKSGYNRKIKEKILKPQLNTNGYYSISLHKDNKIVKKLVHVLVALAFLPNPNNLTQVNHIDGNKLNNKINNLEWCTNRENTCHFYKKKNKTSKYIGVYKSKNKWVAQIMINNKIKHIGRFSEENEAYLARVNYEKDNNIINKYN